MSDYDDCYDDYWDGDDDDGGSYSYDEIKADLFAVLEMAKPEIPGLRLALVEGRIDGDFYSGECACLKGTIANIRGCDVNHMEGITLNCNLPAEQWFLHIEEGDTPENNEYSALAVQWIDEFVAGLK